MKSKIKILFIIIMIMIATLLISTNFYEVFAVEEVDSEKVSEEQQFIYLSDIPYITNQSRPGWGNITMDKTTEGETLSLRINGSVAVFKKGIFAHATSTVVYDITNYDYDYFTTYYGVSSHRGNNGSVKFYIYTSEDGKSWDLQTEQNPSILRGNSNAEFVKIPIKNKKFIKLYADADGNNGADHALYGDAKLIKEGYNENVTKTVEEYDKEIKEKYKGGEIAGELELLLLQREFVSRVGSFSLRTFVEENPKENKETLDWIMNDQEMLRLYLVGGLPEGTYVKSLEVLTTMRKKYKSDLETEEISKYGTPLKNVYRTMILAISLTHSGNVYLWIDGKVYSTPENRYEIYKKLYNNDLIESQIFETLTVEEMRWVMNTIIDDEEIEWLNDYTRTVKNGATGPYSYIRYTFGYNYWLDKYYTQENYKQWDEKYNLSKWNITYKSGQPKLWIVFEEGSVCGGLSKTGSCVWGSYKGLPNTCVSQPGHCAYIMYSRDVNGNGVWNLGNDVSGWGPSGNTEHLNTRMMNDWKATEGGWAAPYVLLAQAAQNEYEVYEKAQIQMMLAKVYSAEPAKQEEIYRNVLKTENINFGAWESLINLYIADSTKNEQDYYKLADEVATALTYYPKPMVDLLTKLERKLSLPEYVAGFNNIKTKALKLASVADASKTIQVKAVNQVANYLLGLYDSKIATFSFDGENANSILLGEKFSESEVQWDYSLDGGKTWTQTGEHAQKLTREEINLITVENDIKIHIIGVDYSDKNVYVIDITKANRLANLYNNDLENKVIGATSSMEWRFDENEEWTSYGESEPDLTGDKTVQLRVGATGTNLPSDVWTYSFTEDNQPDNRKYIPISNLSIHEVSSEATSNNGHATHAIDGNINSIWHSNYNGQDSQRYIIIKLAEAKYISALEYIPRQSGTNGRVGKCILSLSMDGEEWNEVGNANWANNASTKSIELEESVKAQYIKLQALTNYGDGRNFISAMMINLFEDINGERPRAEIEYSTPLSSAQPVVVKLVNPSTKIIITNNGGSDTYIFTDNGQFTFEFEDEKGRKGTATATVLSMRECDFSFDGEMANKIVLSQKYKPNASDNLKWQYSLDGGETWSEYQNSLIIDLSPEEIARITEEEDIQLRINIEESVIGESEHTIEIQPGSPLPSNLYANDLENRLIGATSSMEWKLSGATEWTSFDNDNKTTFLGDKNIEVRIKSTGTTSPSESRTFTFTQDIENKKKTYIPIEYLSIDAFSSESVRPERNEYEYAKNAIDGNINTIWHTNHTTGTNSDGTSVDERYIVIKLTEPKYISHIQYVAKPNYNFGVMQDGIVQTSVDNKNWTDAAHITGEKIENAQGLEDKYVKEIAFENPTYAKYIKIKCTTSYDYIFGTDNTSKKPMNYFISAAMFNLFEDTTKNAEAVKTKIEYSTTEKTNENVTARILSVDGSNITIINNDGNDIYTFTQNGEFTFEYKDSNGFLGTAKAEVTWIGKVPTAVVSYSTTEKTTESVIATITFSEEVKILTENFVLEKKDNKTYTYTFAENLVFTLEFEDMAGNKGEPVKLAVDWIEKQAPIAEITYSITELTNKNVVATITCKEPITVTNNNGQKTYTFVDNGTMVFEYMTDNYLKGTVTAKVDWIDKVPPVATVTYDITDKTTNNVTATLTCEAEEIIITNNEGSNKHIFTENDSFVFKYKDLAGNINSTKATVDWIDKKQEQPEVYLNSSKYIVDTPNNLITKINEKTKVSTFKESVETNSNITIVNKKGEILKDEDIISTGDILKLENTEKSYTLVVRGDTDGDGRITINDLAQVKLHCIENKMLEGVYIKAADVDLDGAVNVNDVAQIRLVIIDLMTLE